MPAELHWNLNDQPKGDGFGAPEPTVVPPRRKRTSRWILSGIYIVALIATAWVGYALGRWSEGEALSLEGIDNQLAIETLAWREGDVALYRTTLHPGAPAPWQRSLLDRFATEAPRSIALRAAAKQMASDRMAQVTVVVVDGPVETIEERTYEISGNSWYRSNSASATGDE